MAKFDQDADDLLVARSGPAVRIYSSIDGGPVRRIINGRRSIYTGMFVSVKAGMDQMPWESRFCERDGMTLMEASSRVISLLAQPHRLEMDVEEQRAPLIYFPDVEAQVTPCFVDDLVKGVPFSEAALAMNRSRFSNGEARRVILEFKDAKDTRRHKPAYRAKLNLAKQVYSSLGIDFFEIERVSGILPQHVWLARHVINRALAKLLPEDIWAVKAFLASKGGSATAGELAALMGPRAVGWGKLKALHVRRIVEMAISTELTRDTAVCTGGFNVP